MKSGTKEQAVCVNVAVLYEPSVAGVITDNGKATQAPEMEIIGSDTVMLPEVSTNQMTILGAVARGGVSGPSGGGDHSTPGQGGGDSDVQDPIPPPTPGGGSRN